jgi:catechol 2,3-dioxygenase-like lactoylglutathione lyase family enzyme
MDRALMFYRDILGFRVEWDKTGLNIAEIVALPDANARQVMLQGYGLCVELVKYYTPEGKARMPSRLCDFGLTHFCLSVRNIKEVHKALVKKGAEFNSPPREVRPGVWAAYFKDPEGVAIELVERLEG